MWSKAQDRCREGGTHMLLGTHAPKLDDKGRVILPAKFREELQGGLVITRGQENCLYVFSSAEFAAVHDKIRQAPVTSIEARNYLRVFLSGASDELPDKQGRVTIPAALRQYAGLDKDLIVIGVGARAEIWNAKSWNEYLAKQETAFANVAAEVIPGLF